MKTALLMKGNVRQIILTPEDDDERQILELFARKESEVTAYFGEFTIDQCHGGWLKEYISNKSLMFTITLPPPR